MDEPKRLSNLTDHKLDFTDAWEADWDSALLIPSYRGRRGEPRSVAIVPFRGNLIAVVFTPLGSEAISVISMRRASRKERAAYAKTL